MKQTETTARNANIVTTTVGQSQVGKSSFGVGIIGALIGSVCCLLPALALAFGLGGASALVGLGRYQPYVVVASLLFVGGMSCYMVSRRQACCETSEQRRALFLWPVVAMVAYGVVYIVVNYAIVPWLYDLAQSRMPSM